jgi:hypothetical protein
MAAAGMMRVFQACPVPDRRLLGGSPRIDCGSAGNPNSAVNRKKNPILAFFCEHPTPKHALIQVFAG